MKLLRKMQKVWTGGENDRLLTLGVPGTAVITSVTSPLIGFRIGGGTDSSTGTPVHKWGLTVTVAGHDPFDTEHWQLPPNAWQGFVGSTPQGLVGQTVAVKLDPEDPTDLVIDWAGSPGSGATDLPGRLSGGGPPPAVHDLETILSAGVPGQATVVTHLPSRKKSPRTGNPLHYFLLEVHVADNRPPFRIELTYGVPPDKADRATEGAELPVKVIANDAGGVAIDWDAA